MSTRNLTLVNLVNQAGVRPQDAILSSFPPEKPCFEKVMWFHLGLYSSKLEAEIHFRSDLSENRRTRLVLIFTASHEANTNSQNFYQQRPRSGHHSYRVYHHLAVGKQHTAAVCCVLAY